MLNYRRYVKAIPKPQKNGKYSGYRCLNYEGTITLCGDKLAPIAEKLIPVDFVYNMVK